MDNNDQTPEEYIEIADKVRSGEYFRDARAMADLEIHNPMSERYLYIFLTIFSLIVTLVSLLALQGLFPLKPRIPFIFVTNDIVEDYPQIKSLLDYNREDPNVALRRFLAQQYVKTREEYYAELFDRNHSAVQALSNEKVVAEYEKFILPTNAESPITLYQRHTERKINIVKIQVVENNVEKQSASNEYYMRIIFNSTLVKGEEEKSPTLHQVDVAFKYEDIKLDEEIGKITPYGFLVTSYNVKNL